MSIFVFSNNASSLLASSIGVSDTELSVQSGQGILFPAILAGQVAPITLEDVNGNVEVVYATARTGDTLVVSRAQENTVSPSAGFASGSRVEQRVTAGALSAFLQKDGGDTLSGTTDITGILDLGSGGSIQGGEIAGTPMRSQPGDTSNQIDVPVGLPATAGGSILLTAANLINNLPPSTGFVVPYMIVIWYGTTLTVPSGWALCDGTNNTPDLRDKFIVGGGGSLPVTGEFPFTTGPTSAGTPVMGSSGVLTAANLPPHSHGNVIYAGNLGAKVGPTGTAAGGDYFTAGSGAGLPINWNTDLGPGTSAPLSFVGTALAEHTHTAAAPPYTAVFFIMKLP